MRSARAADDDMTLADRILEIAIVAAESSGDPNDCLRVAEAAIALGNPEVARRLLGRLEKAEREWWWPATLARTHAELGDRASVDRLRGLTEASIARKKLTPGDTSVSLADLAMAYEILGDPQTADLLIGRSGAETAEVTIANLAQAAAKKGRPARAEQLLRHKLLGGVKNAQLRADVLLAMARHALKEGKKRDAEKLLDRAAKTAGVAKDKTIGETLAEIAIVYGSLQRKNQALVLARHAQKKLADPATWPPALAAAFQAGGDAKTAETILQAIEGRTAYSPAGKAEAARMWADRGEEGRARDLLANATAEDSPGDAAGELAKAHAAVGDFGPAIDHAARVTAEAKERVALLLFLARMAHERNAKVDKGLAAGLARLEKAQRTKHR
jgi:hypothetical protein